MSGKVITINPDLFKTSKTKKNRSSEKSKVSIPKPIIKPNTIKQKLLKRIKEHKINESKTKDMLEENDEIHGEDNNEYENALDFFDELKHREKEKQKLLTKTFKQRHTHQYQPTNINQQPNIIPNLSINIPHQLKPSNSININANNTDDIVNQILQDLPYGCLKNGNKPTYKTWKNGIQNYSDMAISDKINLTRPPTPPKKKTENNFSAITHDSVIDTTTTTNTNKYKEAILKKQIDDKLKEIQSQQRQIFEENDNENVNDNENNNVEKQYIKKTTKKKYNLGKSSKYRKVGILIKGRQTKKNIINSHKKLKKTDMHQIKKYLKKRGMLKTGSNCPDEILRKMYESAILSGDIRNVNEDTLIHNFLNDTENIPN